MAAQLDQVIQRLREAILSASAHAPGDWLREISVAEELGVSRTLARLAFATLEKEGLVTREPNRGFRVRSFTVDEVSDAILVRGELEGMAARLCAERGLPKAAETAMRTCLEEAEALLRKGFAELETRTAWIGMNDRFHAALLEASGNRALVEAVAHVSKVPLASPRAIVFDLSIDDQGFGQLRRSHDDHANLLGAILGRQGLRAQAIAQEHAHRSATNKRTNIVAMKSVTTMPPLEGLGLVSASE